MPILLHRTEIAKKPLRKMFRPYRILIMKYLERGGEDGISFQQLKTLLNITDGNLASHLSSLEADNYTTFTKIINGHKMTTVYRLTPQGRDILQRFTRELLDILNG